MSTLSGMQPAPELVTVDPTTVTAACYTGDHRHCDRRLLLTTPDGPRMYGVCACPVCTHVGDYRKTPRS